MNVWQVYGSVSLALTLGLAGGLSVAAQESGQDVDDGMSGRVDETEQSTYSHTHPPIHPSTPTPIHPPALTLSDWVAQIEASLTQITGVRVEETEAGLQLVLETAEGDLPAPTTQTVGNALIADIPNAVLVLPDGNSFEQFAPAEGIALVSATNEPGDLVRVAITGTDAPPVAAVTATGLAVTLGEAVVGAEDDAIQVVVTGEQDGYRIPNTSVGTRTSAPLRDIPQSIQVVPQQLLQDQQVTRLDDALRNVPGVTADFNSGPTLTYRIRGFEALNNNLLRNGQVDAGGGEYVELGSVERVEVLRGPASVLFGLGNPGGSINLVTKQPLSEPFYAVDATLGSYSFYRGAVDLSGPLNESGTVLYRLNGAYRNSGSFIDFYNSDNLNISPVISVISDRGSLTLEGDYIETRDSGFTPFVPVIGSVLPNPNGTIPRSRNVGEPSDRIDSTLTRVGYRLEHELSDTWTIRNSFLYNNRDYSDRRTLPGSLGADNRTLSRSYREYDFVSTSYNLATNVVGEFLTGSLQHELLLGFDINSYENLVPSFRSAAAAPLDIFNPVYGQPPGALGEDFRNTAITRSLGFYIQDKIDLTDNLIVLLGGRFDLFDQVSKDFSTNSESTLSDSAFSPRLGIVYQPIEPLSLYASYTRSFTPGSGVFLFGGALDQTIQPERGQQFEIGAKADLTDRLSATLALYDLTRTNVLTEDPNNPGFQIQTGEQNSRGLELNAAGEILPGWNVYAGYAYTDARITQDNTFTVGNRLPNTPYHSFNLWTAYEIQAGNLQGLGAGLGLFFVGDRAGDLENTYDIPNYLRTDAAVFYNRDQFRAALNIRNLFDITYFENGSSSTRVNYGQPLTIQGTVSWQF
ncbi:MAG: TonB-dependent siderophore receptor [Kaiparowitsia implicata GSE-PSE-MK54-09C]|jgi:iron complex outermembrane receptor protein|nr:TonB-dependent siderophore receptor [Kaiparowitsia implicata GSE-PSE-MK54-09C]